MVQDDPLVQGYSPTVVLNKDAIHRLSSFDQSIRDIPTESIRGLLGKFLTTKQYTWNLYKIILNVNGDLKKKRMIFNCYKSYWKKKNTKTKPRLLNCLGHLKKFIFSINVILTLYQSILLYFKRLFSLLFLHFQTIVQFCLSIWR